MRIAPFAIITFAILAACGGAETGQASNAQANKNAAANPTRVSASGAARVMHDRHEAMERLGKAMKELHRALDASPLDVNAVRAQTAIMATIAPKIPAFFPAGTGPDVGKTRAKPEIWQQQDLFIRKSKDFGAAAQAIDAAAKAGDMNKVMGLHDRVDQACDACHKPFRAPEH
jgi:cytochrome c556